MSAIFISHSSRDNEAAAEVRDRLEEQGQRSIFLDFDPADGIPAGRSWEQELYARLKACQAILVLCSEHSMASDWCFAEITHAKSMGKHVFPLKVAPCEIRSLLNEFQILDLTADREDAYTRLWRGLEIAGLDPKNMFDWDGSRPPYPGLLAFQEKDAAIFFGRDNEIREGLSHLRRLERFGGARWTLVLGASGSGKSSLVRAGLVPRLGRDRDSWIVTRPFRPLEQPFVELSTVLAEAFELHRAPRSEMETRRILYPPTGISKGASLNRMADELRIAAGRPEASVLLFIDQLEEILGRDTGDQATRFLAFLRAAIEEPRSPIRVLATLRSDFLGDFQGHPALRDLAFETLNVGPMSVDGFAQVIEGPAELAGIELQAGLVQAMVGDTETEDALPLLAFTLRELWEGYGQDARLGVDEYREKLGGLHGAVALAAEAVLTSRTLSEREEADLRTAFLAMVRINEDGQYARQPARWSELPPSVHDLLDRFVEARLLVARGDERENRLEVAHEALLRSWHRLVGWLDEDRSFLLWRRRIEEARREWERTENHPSTLLRGPALKEAEGWLEQRGDLLSSQQQTFLRTSLAAARRQKRILIALAAALMVMLAGFAGWTHVQRMLAERIRTFSHDVTILAHARSLNRVAPAKSARLLLQLHHPDLYLYSLDLDQLAASGRLLTRSPDSMLAVTSSGEGDVGVHWTYDDRWSVHLQHDSPVYKAEIEGPPAKGISEMRSFIKDVKRRRHVLTATEDLKVRLWSLPKIESLVASVLDAKLPPLSQDHDPHEARLLVEFDGHDQRVSRMSFSRDGRYAVTISGDQVAVWRTNSGSEPLIVAGHRADVTAAAFSPDGRQLVTASSDGTLLIRDLKDLFAPPIACRGHRMPLISAAFSPDGATLLTLSSDGEVWRWSAADGSGSKATVVDCQVLEIAYIDLDGTAGVACADGSARLFNVDAGGEMRVLR